MRSLKTLAVLGMLVIGLLAVTPSVAEAQVLGQRYNVNYYSPGPYYVPARTAMYYAGPGYTYYQPTPVYPAYTYAAEGMYQVGYTPVYGAYYTRGVGPFFRTSSYYYRWR